MSHLDLILLIQDHTHIKSNSSIKTRTTSSEDGVIVLCKVESIAHSSLACNNSEFLIYISSVLNYLLGVIKFYYDLMSVRACFNSL